MQNLTFQNQLFKPFDDFSKRVHYQRCSFQNWWTPFMNFSFAKNTENYNFSVSAAKLGKEYFCTGLDFNQNQFQFFSEHHDIDKDLVQKLKFQKEFEIQQNIDGIFYVCPLNSTGGIGLKFHDENQPLNYLNLLIDFPTPFISLSNFMPHFETVWAMNKNTKFGIKYYYQEHTRQALSEMAVLREMYPNQEMQRQLAKKSRSQFQREISQNARFESRRVWKIGGRIQNWHPDGKKIYLLQFMDLQENFGFMNTIWLHLATISSFCNKTWEPENSKIVKTIQNSMKKVENYEKFLSFYPKNDLKLLINLKYQKKQRVQDWLQVIAEQKFQRGHSFKIFINPFVDTAEQLEFQAKFRSFGEKQGNFIQLNSKIDFRQPNRSPTFGLEFGIEM